MRLSTLVIIFIPLLNFILCTVFARFVTRYWLLAFLMVCNMIIALGATVALYPAIVSGQAAHAFIGSWITCGLFTVNWSLVIDAVVFTMLFVVLLVSTVVHAYSTEYMSEDPHTPRFMSYLSLFTFFMLLLITSDNLIGLFLGWEGVGLCSYLLISFWFTRVQANKSAIKAMVVNRIADMAFTLGIVVTFYTFQTVDFNIILGTAPFFEAQTIIFANCTVAPTTAIAFLLFLGAMGKSAQIGLHTWLPDAMEGPTPVSALIHAATMVTAGVFLIVRCSALFETAPTVLVFIAAIGATTAFMAGTSGLVQNDIKKVIAYSTCSQLGYMVFICGLSQYSLGLFHLTNHAFFKALLFLSAGAVIHAVSSEQDLRRFGGYTQLLVVTYTMLLIGSLALMGTPFLTGFYSKDIILEVTAGLQLSISKFAFGLGLYTALLTAFYSFRLLYLTFYGAALSPRAYLVNTHELSKKMAAALAVLAIGSIFAGFALRDLFIGLGTEFWNGTISTANGVPWSLAVNGNTTPNLVTFSDVITSSASSGAVQIADITGEFVPQAIKFAPLFGSIAAIIIVFMLYSLPYPSAQAFTYSGIAQNFYYFFSHKWYFDTIYNRLINQPFLQQAYSTIFATIDKGVLEAVGPTGFSRTAHRLGNFLNALQTGRVYDYAWFMLCGVLLFSAVSSTAVPAIATAAILPLRRDITVKLQNALRLATIYAPKIPLVLFALITAIITWHVLLFVAKHIKPVYIFEILIPTTTICASLAVPNLTHPVKSLLALITIFFSIAASFIVIGAEFMGLIILIVYVGAIAILFLFVIMLLNLTSETSKKVQVTAHHFERCSCALAAGFAGLWLFYLLQIVVLEALGEATAYPTSFSGNEAARVAYFINYQFTDLQPLSIALYSEQQYHFILITFVLVVAMIGAIVLATTSKKRPSVIA